MVPVQITRALTMRGDAYEGSEWIRELSKKLEDNVCDGLKGGRNDG